MGMFARVAATLGAVAVTLGISAVSSAQASAAGTAPEQTATTQDLDSRHCIGARVRRCIEVQENSYTYLRAHTWIRDNQRDRPNYRVLMRDMHFQRWNGQDWVLERGAGRGSHNGFHDVGESVLGPYFLPRCDTYYRVRVWTQWIDGPDPGGRWMTNPHFYYNC